MIDNRTYIIESRKSNEQFKYYVHSDELFDILYYEAHSSTGHKRLQGEL
jgi:hypothetical protein